jgi:hypothetical protein
MKVTVSKALKIKNRLVALIKEKGNEIGENNSVVKDGIRKVDVRKEIEVHKNAVETLVKVKTAIYRSNMDIQEKVFRLSEVKSLISFWGNVSCDEGLCRFVSRDIFSERSKDLYEMTTILNFEEIREIKKELTIEADKLQDELDNHNHTTHIEIPDEAVNLGVKM